MRAGRPADKSLAVSTVVGTACWALVALAFGASIGNVLDARAMFHFWVSLVLVVFGLRTLRV